MLINGPHLRIIDLILHVNINNREGLGRDTSGCAGTDASIIH